MNQQDMTRKMAEGQGFIAALDQSGGSTPKALRAYGVDDSEWNGEDEMFARIHEMRCRIITSPSFANGKVIGAILFEKTMDGMVDGKPVPQALIEHPKVLRVVALSGGYSTEKACEELAKNEGMIASFSRGLLQDLRADQSEEEFDRTLGAAIDQIYRASVT